MMVANSAFSDEPASGVQSSALEVNNSWQVWGVFKNHDIPNPIYVTIRPSGRHWDIDGIYDYLPQVLRSDDVELFMATRDLQFWRNAYAERVIGCDNFEVKESDYQSTCTSRFGERKTAQAIVGAFFGRNGGVAFSYNTDKVAEAIHSIRPEQAEEKLNAFEKSEN